MLYSQLKSHRLDYGNYERFSHFVISSKPLTTRARAIIPPFVLTISNLSVYKLENALLCTVINILLHSCSNKCLKRSYTKSSFILHWSKKGYKYIAFAQIYTPLTFILNQIPPGFQSVKFSKHFLSGHRTNKKLPPDHTLPHGP